MPYREENFGIPEDDGFALFYPVQRIDTEPAEKFKDVKEGDY